MSILLQQENILSLLSLTVMEIVLGIDNIIFISIPRGTVATCA
jgi:predicted tellurium resistance membrane protein TerC